MTQKRQIISPKETNPIRVGDEVWVREKWRVGAFRGNQSPRFAIDYRATPELVQTPWLYPGATSSSMSLLAQSVDDVNQALGPSEFKRKWEYGKGPCRDRAAFCMPQWASRLTLIVTDVRIMPLLKTNIGDICAEGLAENIWQFCPVTDGLRQMQEHWNASHSKPGTTWDDNPTVTAYTFEVHRCNIRAMKEAA